MGRNHLRVLSDLDGVELAAVCDTDEKVVATASRKHSVAGYVSWAEMLERERLDAAVVAVPTRFHLEVGLAVLERGLHVLIEKPIATTLEEGRRLVGAARDEDRVFAVGHIERFNPAVRELRRRLIVSRGCARAKAWAASRGFQPDARMLPCLATCAGSQR